MRILKTIGLLALLVFGTASSCSPDPKQLAPIPAPIAVIVKVPVLVRLSPDATAPCPEPHEPAGGVQMESQLGAGGMGWRVTAECNANKLKAIEAAQPGGQP